MPDIHVTRELLEAWDRNELDLPRLLKIGIEHLSHCCSHCARELSAWMQAREGRAGAGLMTLESLRALLQGQLPREEAEQRQALRDFRALLRVAPEERLEKVRRARKRFALPALAVLLLEEGGRCLPAHPEQARQLARLAEEVLRRTEVSGPAYAALYAQVLAHQGNAQRALGDLREAERFFVWARHLIRQDGVVDLEVCAEIDSLEGSLRKDLRQFPEAVDALSQSVLLYRISGSAVEAACSLMKLSTVFYQQGDAGRAIQTLRMALPDLDRLSQPRLHLQARYNLALYLCEIREYGQARRLLGEDRELHQRFPDDWTQLRLRWLEGKVADGLGETELAEQSLLAAHQGFVAQSNGYDAALVALDLAALYLKQGRSGEIQTLAREVVALFQAQGIGREVLAALLLFREAALNEGLSRTFLRDLTLYLERARKNPTLPFNAG